MAPKRTPTPIATASVTSGRCSTSWERRRRATFPNFVASLPKFTASSLTEPALPANRPAKLLNTEATASPRPSAAFDALTAARLQRVQVVAQETECAVQFRPYAP